MRENPNDGKRHSAPATARRHSFTENERTRIREARADYRPLTVKTQFQADALGRVRATYRRDRPSWTSDGYTV
jgi:hypothetical protein